MNNLEKIDGKCIGFCPSCQHIKDNPTLDIPFCQSLNILQKLTRLEIKVTELNEYVEKDKKSETKKFVSEDCSEKVDGDDDPLEE